MTVKANPALKGSHFRGAVILTLPGWNVERKDEVEIAQIFTIQNCVVKTTFVFYLAS